MYSVTRTEFSNAPRGGAWDVRREGSTIARIELSQLEPEKPRRIGWVWDTDDDVLRGIVEVKNWIPPDIGDALQSIIRIAGLEEEIAWGPYRPRSVQRVEVEQDTLRYLFDDDDMPRMELTRALRELADLVQEGRNSVATLEEYQRQATQALGYTGAPALARGYQEAADRARRGALVWHVLAVLGFLCLIAFAVTVIVTGEHTVSSTVSDNQMWRGIARRVFFSTAILLFTGYAGKQAANSRKDELRFRRTELELIALGPFVADLPDDERASVKQALAQRFFGRELSSAEPAPPTKDAHPLALLRELIAKLPNHAG